MPVTRPDMFPSQHCHGQTKNLTQKKKTQMDANPVIPAKSLPRLAPSLSTMGQPGLKSAVTVACVYGAYSRPLAEQVGAAMLAVK